VTRIDSPLTQCESSEARNTAVGAISSGSPKRPSGVSASARVPMSPTNAPSVARVLV